MDEKSCDLKIQHRQREVNVLRFSSDPVQITDPNMKLAQIQPERHGRWPNQGASIAKMLRSEIAPIYTAVGEDRFSLVLDEAESPPSVQVGDGKRVKHFNHFSEAAQQLPLPCLLR